MDVRQYGSRIAGEYICEVFHSRTTSDTFAVWACTHIIRLPLKVEPRNVHTRPTSELG